MGRVKLENQRYKDKVRVGRKYKDVSVHDPRAGKKDMGNVLKQKRWRAACGGRMA